MGSFPSRIEITRLDTGYHSDTTGSQDRNVSQQITCWEKTYEERFARPHKYSFTTNGPLMDGFWRPTVLPNRWKARLDPDLPNNQCNPRYAGPTPEPLSKELEARTRQELILNYREILTMQAVDPRTNGGWTIDYDNCTHVPYLSHGDTFPPNLLNGYIGLANFPGLIAHAIRNPTQLPKLPNEYLLAAPWLNQTIAVYFEPEFLRQRRGANCRYMARGLLVAWLEHHHIAGETPNFQQFRSFATPVMLSGPAHRPIKDVVCTHKIICETIQDAQNKPISPKDPYSWIEHGCEMGPVYRSILVVIDEQPLMQRGYDEAEQREIIFKQCSVLLVRTGDEDHLSAPIDLSELVATGLALPLGRDEDEAPLDAKNGRQQVVRVRLRTAVRFIMELERREREGSARLTAMKRVLDAESLREADAWATEALANAEENGSIDRDFHTWEAVRRARAYLDGDRYKLEGEPSFQDKYTLRRR